VLSRAEPCAEGGLTARCAHQKKQICWFYAVVLTLMRFLDDDAYFKMVMMQYCDEMMRSDAFGPCDCDEIDAFSWRKGRGKPYIIF